MKYNHIGLTPRFCTIVIVLSLLFGTHVAKAQADWFPSGCPGTSRMVVLPSRMEASAESWKLIFEDNFDGTTLDRTKWNTSFPYPAPDDRARPAEGPCIYMDNNIILNQGVASVQVRHEANAQSYPLTNPVLTSNYTGGVMITKGDVGDMRFGEGLFEMSCRFPMGSDGWIGRPLWPAFWLIGGECGREEIDVFELNDTQWTDRGTLFTTLHGIAGGTENQARNITCANCIGETPTSRKTNENFWVTDGNFHVFGLAWDPTCITWYVDHVPIHHHYRFYDMLWNPMGCSVPSGSWREHAMWPKHNNLQIIVSMGMGNELPDGTINFSGPNNAASMEVDYVRAYKRIPFSDPGNLCGSTITGDNVVCTADNYTVNFRTPTTQINWTCSSNLVLSSTTGASVTVNPATPGLTEQGWITAEPVFATGSACSAADARVTKNVWIGLPISFNNFVAALHSYNKNTCQDF